MMVLPLQAALAAVETYHGHGPEHESVIETVLHTHVDHDHHEHDNTPQGKACDGDHHHCHAHSVSVLPSSLSNFQPDLRYDEYSPEPMLLTSHLNTRIERPNWC